MPDRTRFITCLRPRRATAFAAAIGACVAISLHVSGEDPPPKPLHELIDLHVATALQKSAIAPAEPASDDEFLRRVTLDLTGWIPRAVETRAFLDDSTADKRTQLIDRLLASPEFARHMSRVFDVMLMERRPDKHVPSPEWREFLRKSFAENTPWDQLVREMLSSDGADPAMRPAAKFVLDRDAEPTLLTKDISRLLLGRNYQCAQCHDHPLVTDYEQQHYYGILAFFNRTALFTDKKNKNLVSLAEKADGDVKFKSVFEKDKPEQTTGPRLFDGIAIDEPKFDKGQEYASAPAADVRAVPKFSRRAQLAKSLPTADLAPFKRNIVNRLWAIMLGRGLVHPLDLDHSDNPPSHPELLDLLADRFVAMKFDVRAFSKEIALSQTYQRSSRLPAGAAEPPPHSFAVAALKPLSPEQLGWSMVQATGAADSHRAALGDKCTEPALHDRLAGGVAAVVATFSGAPGEPDGKFQATLDQALFLANGGAVRSWLAPSAGNLADRLLKLTDSAALADELYLSVLTRRASPEETTDMTDYLSTRTEDRAAAVQELIWALVTAAEFRFNH